MDQNQKVPKLQVGRGWQLLKVSNVFWNRSPNLHPNPDLVSNCRKMQRDVGLIAASVGFGIFLLLMHLKLHPAIKKRVRIPGNNNLR